MNLPIIKLEVEGMRHTIQVALDRHAAAMDSYVQEALDKYCQEDNLRAIVTMQATQAIDAAVKKCIQDFFQYGKGRKHIKAAVEERLSQWDDYDDL